MSRPLGKLIPFVKNKAINLTRKQHKFVSLERATIAERQGASEDQKFIAKLPQSNRTLFFTNGIRAAAFVGYFDRFCIENTDQKKAKATKHLYRDRFITLEKTEVY